MRDTTTRPARSPAVTGRLKTAGIPTFVVGISAGGAPEQALNQMAVEGGYPQANQATQFYPVSSTAEFAAVLRTLVATANTSMLNLPPPPTNDGTTSRADIEVKGTTSGGAVTAIPQDATERLETYADAGKYRRFRAARHGVRSVEGANHHDRDDRVPRPHPCRSAAVEFCRLSRRSPCGSESWTRDSRGRARRRPWPRTTPRRRSPRRRKPRRRRRKRRRRRRSPRRRSPRPRPFTPPPPQAGGRASCSFPRSDSTRSRGTRARARASVSGLGLMAGSRMGENWSLNVGFAFDKVNLDGPNASRCVFDLGFNPLIHFPLEKLELVVGPILAVFLDKGAAGTGNFSRPTCGPMDGRSAQTRGCCSPSAPRSAWAGC